MTQCRSQTEIMRLEMTQMGSMEELRSGGPFTPIATNNDTSSPTSAKNHIHHRDHYGHKAHHLDQHHLQQILLERLKVMVPIMPRGRELSKLEVINYVIDYIKQLRELVMEEDETEAARTALHCESN